MIFKEIFNYINSTPWKDNTNYEDIVLITKNFCHSHFSSATNSKTFYRVCGQSGSGKTTQVSASILKVCEMKKTHPAYITVRTFASLHPNYHELLNIYGENLIREKTNGFSLKCLAVAIYELMKESKFIVLEVTLLDVKFEKFIIKLSEHFNYKIHFNLLAVNKKVSNFFIKKRMLSSNGKEKGRVTFKKSYNYFNKVFTKGLRYLIKKQNHQQIVIWSAYHLSPVFEGILKHSFTAYKKYKKLILKQLKPESLLLKNKIKYYKTNLIIN